VTTSLAATSDRDIAADSGSTRALRFIREARACLRRGGRLSPREVEGDDMGLLGLLPPHHIDRVAREAAIEGERATVDRIVETRPEGRQALGRPREPAPTAPRPTVDHQSEVGAECPRAPRMES